MNEFKKYIENTADGKYLKMLHGEAKSPFTDELRVNSLSEYLKNREEYVSRLEREREEFNDAVNTVKLNVQRRKWRREEVGERIVLVFKIILALLISAAALNVIIGMMVIDAYTVDDVVTISLKHRFVHEIYNFLGGRFIFVLLFYWLITSVPVLLIRFVVTYIGGDDNGGWATVILSLLTPAVSLVTFVIMMFAFNNYQGVFSLIFSIVVLFGPAIALSVVSIKTFYDYH